MAEESHLLHFHNILEDDGVRLHNFTKYKKEWLHHQTKYRNLKM